ncbi:MAG TPA: tetraacyldisaccharide 4'-kinase [Polyangiaceae bacterium]
MLLVARALEEGVFGGPLARAAAQIWGSVSARHVVRPLELPPHVRVVAVGGATLGGSGKTPLAIACARELARTGARVALVGHAYRARPGCPRVVSPGDPLALVGDEALVAAAELEAAGVPVVVAPDRASAVAFAARSADVLVLDGVAQTRPRPATLALLAVDPEEPWGRAAALPPCGDLRAPVEALLAAVDAVVPVNEADDPGPFPWDALRGARVGLVSALARPHRVLRSLARRGIVPRVVVRARDHTPVAIRALRQHERSRSVDVWVATRKCSLHAPRPTLTRERLMVLPHAILLPPWLGAALARIGHALTPADQGNNLKCHEGLRPHA